VIVGSVSHFFLIIIVLVKRNPFVKYAPVLVPNRSPIVNDKVLRPPKWQNLLSISNDDESKRDSQTMLCQILSDAVSNYSALVKQKNPRGSCKTLVMYAASMSALLIGANPQLRLPKVRKDIQKAMGLLSTVSSNGFNYHQLSRHRQRGTLPALDIHRQQDKFCQNQSCCHQNGINKNLSDAAASSRLRLQQREATNRRMKYL